MMPKSHSRIAVHKLSAKVGGLAGISKGHVEDFIYVVGPHAVVEHSEGI